MSLISSLFPELKTVEKQYRKLISENAIIKDGLFKLNESLEQVIVSQREIVECNELLGNKYGILNGSGIETLQEVWIHDLLVNTKGKKFIFHHIDKISGDINEYGNTQFVKALVQKGYVYVLYISDPARLCTSGSVFDLGNNVYLTSSTELLLQQRENIIFYTSTNLIEQDTDLVEQLKARGCFIIYEFDGIASSVQSEAKALAFHQKLLSDESNLVIATSRIAVREVKSVRKYNYCAILKSELNSYLAALQFNALIELYGYNYQSEKLSAIQDEILKIFRKDSPEKTSYYELAYKDAEKSYWFPVLGWIDSLPHVNSIIDIGAAYGTLLLYTIKSFNVNRSVVIDPVGYMAKSYIEENNVEFFGKDIEKDQFSELGKFDLILFTEVLEHLNYYPHSTLHKIKSLLSEGGYLILSTPDSQEWGTTTKYYNSLGEVPIYSNQVEPWKDDHIWQYSFEELIGVVTEAGFKIADVGYSKGGVARHMCLLLQAE